MNQALHAFNKLPPVPWKCKQKNRGSKAVHRSLLYILSVIIWHCVNDDNYKQLIGCLIDHLQEKQGKINPDLTSEQGNQMMQQANLTFNQMRKIRRLLRQYRGKMVLASEQSIKEIHWGTQMLTGEVHAIVLELTKSEKNKRQHIPNYKTEVYHCNTMEAICKLIDATFRLNQFYIEKPLTPHEFTLQIGWDKSEGGLAESICVNIRAKYHGKYHSIVTTLTDDKIQENYSNYREIAKNWHKDDISNKLCLLPNVILVVQYVQEEDAIVSKLIKSFVMTIDSNQQKSLDAKERDRLNSIQSPAAVQTQIQETDMTNALNGSNCSVLTQNFWIKKLQMPYIKSLCCVQLPLDLANRIDTKYSETEQKRINEQAIKWQMKQETDVSDTDEQSNRSDSDGSDSEHVSNARARARGFKYDLRTLWRQKGSNSSDGSVTVVTRDTESWCEEDEEQYPTDDGDHYYQSNSDSSVATEQDIIETVHPLHRFHFNAGSVLNRMVESEWNQRCSHVAASDLQQSKIYAISLSLIANDFRNNPTNSDILLVNGVKCDQMITCDLLFDCYNGLRFFWLSHVLIPKPHVRRQDKMTTLMIVENQTVHGIIIVLIEAWDPTKIPWQQQENRLHDGSYCKAVILARSRNWEGMTVSDVIWQKCLTDRYINQSKDFQLFTKIAHSDVGYESDMMHCTVFFSVELETYMQWDNKGKNICAGIATSASNYPCSVCYASKNQIKQKPTPDQFVFQSRNYAESVKYALSKKRYQNNVMGCQLSPIYDIPVHKRSPTTLHENEGIYAVIISTLRDCIIEITGGTSDVDMKDACAQADVLEKQYEKIVRIQDLLECNNKLNENTVNTDELKQELQTLKAQYVNDHTNFETQLRNRETNDALVEFYGIMSKYKIELYYVMSGSVKGAVCGRFNNAAKDICDFLSKYDQSVSVVWEMLIDNVTYIYNMMKHKHKKQFTFMDQCTLKQAYLDLYYQLIVVVNKWRQDGSIGIKIHYLMHDLEHSWRKKRSAAFEDDQRFENVNQAVKGVRRMYQNYLQKDKTLRMANRMNNRALT